MKVNKKYIFVVGCPRSGTKFIRGVLNQHPEVAICPETHFFSSVVHKGVIKTTRHLSPFQTDLQLDELRALLVSGQIFGSFWKEPGIIDFDELVANFASSGRTYREMFDLLMRQYAKENGKAIAGEKTPSHIYHVDTLVSWFPECRVIHILRDPRSVLNSEMNLRRTKPDYPLRKTSPLYDLGLFLWVLGGWRLATAKHAKYARRYPKNYTLIRYEDLFLDHEETVRTVTAFLNLRFTEAMLNPPVVGSSFQGDITHNPIDGWRDRLPGKYASLLTLFLSRELGKFNY